MARVALNRNDARSGRLPPICLDCGEPAIASVSKVLYCVPLWAFPLYLFAPPFGIAIVSYLTKRASIRAPLCAQHRGHWRWRSWTMWGSFAAILLLQGLLAMFWILSPNDGSSRYRVLAQLVFMAHVMLIASWVTLALIVWFSSIRATAVTSTTIVLTNVSGLFRRRVERPSEL
jgi:hypothetical protein